MSNPFWLDLLAKVYGISMVAGVIIIGVWSCWHEGQRWRNLERDRLRAELGLQEELEKDDHRGTT